MSVKKFNVILKNKISSFDKKIHVDSDKSLSIRSFLIGSICQNISFAKNVLESEDVHSTIRCLKKLGVKIVKTGQKNYSIYGKGLGSFFIKKNSKLDFGNSGTLARLLIGILSTTPNIDVNLNGDNSLKKRNMKKLIELMCEFGASFYPKNKYKFPLRLQSTEIPIGIDYESGVSAQLKSAVILAGLNSFGETNIIEKKRSRNHTENIIKNNTSVININEGKIKKIKIKGKKSLHPLNMNIPGDPSAAAFFTALAILNPKSRLTIKNVGLNETRIGFYKLLKNHGASIQFKKIKRINGELRGDIYVKSSNIKPINASENYYVNSTDEYPILFIIASLTKGISRFRGIGDLVNKESNRISEMQNVLKQIGIKSEASKNELKIFGRGNHIPKNKNIIVPKLGDHRICMSTFVLAILTGIKTKINNFDTVYTSSPSFLKIMRKLGVKFEIKK